MLLYTIYTTLALSPLVVNTQLLVNVQFRDPHIFCRNNKMSATVKRRISLVLSSTIYGLLLLCCPLIKGSHPLMVR